MKFGTYTNSNMLNSVVMLKFSLLDCKFPTFLCGIKIKLGAWANSNMKNSMVMFLVLFRTGNSVFGQI